MLLTLSIRTDSTYKADSTYLRIDCPQTNWQSVIHNTIAYDAVTRRPIEIGVAEDIVRREIAAGPPMAGVQLTFAQPLAVTHFDLERALMTVEYCAMLMQSATRAMWQSFLLDVFVLDIWFEDFERLLPEQQQELEYALKTMRLPGRVRSVLINGRSSFTREFLKGKRQLQLHRNMAEWFWLLLFLGGVLGALSVAKPMFELLIHSTNATTDVLDILTRISLMTVLMGLIFVGVELVATFIYALLLRPWLPTDILRAKFRKQSHLLPTRVVNWLSDTLFGTEPNTP